MMKTLAVVGASYLQLPLVQKAREMGLRTICFAWSDGAVCSNYADIFYPISIVDKEEILAVCRQERISGIASIASDVAVPTVAYVANALGLVGNSVESAAKSTNKFLMREAFCRAGVPCPKFVAVSHVSELPDAIRGMSFPLVVKPTDRSGSMGVARVNAPETLNNAVRIALEDSFCRKAIIEECVTDMHEISVEGISWKGDYHLLQITDKVTTGAPHYVELGHHQPARIPDETRRRVMDAVQRSVAALDIEYGASHAELMITGAGRVFMTEIGARMGGDFIGSDLVRLSTSYDFVRGVIDVALGQFSIPQIGQTGYSGVWFYTRHTPAALDLITEKTAHSEIVRRELQDRKTPVLTRSADRSGYFIYKADRRMDIPVYANYENASIQNPNICGKSQEDGN